MTYLVMVEGDQSGWSLDRATLTEAIRTRWADVVIDPVHRSEARSHLWEFETENGPGEAYLHEDGTCLYMDVWEEDAVWLAIVFRRIAPADLALVFCDEGYTFHVRLDADATEAELTELVNGADA
ncbi:hypothetical protein [Streptomyces sp. NPDC055036]